MDDQFQKWSVTELPPLSLALTILSQAEVDVQQLSKSSSVVQSLEERNDRSLRQSNSSASRSSLSLDDALR